MAQLKIQPAHYAHLKAQFQSLTDAEIREAKRACKNNTQFRHRLLAMRVGSGWICAQLYPYMNDNHLDSALKKIQRDLNLFVDEEQTA